MRTGACSLVLLLAACTRPEAKKEPPIVVDAAVPVVPTDAGKVDPACSGDRIDLTYVSLQAECGARPLSPHAFERVAAPPGALSITVDAPRRLASGAEATVTFTFTSTSDREIAFSVATELAMVGFSRPGDPPVAPPTSNRLRPSLRDAANREWGPPATMPPSTRNVVHLAAHGTAVLRARFRAMGWVPGKKYPLADPDSPPSRLPPGHYIVRGNLPVDGVDAPAFELDVGAR